jgi:hypothetical protein
VTGKLWVIEWRVLPRGAWRFYSPGTMAYVFTSRRDAIRFLNMRDLGFYRGGARVVAYYRRSRHDR